MRRSSITEHPSDAGEADCHSPSGFAMTEVFVPFRSKSGATRNETNVIARSGSDVAIRPPIAQQCISP